MFDQPVPLLPVRIAERRLFRTPEEIVAQNKTEVIIAVQQEHERVYGPDPTLPIVAGMVLHAPGLELTVTVVGLNRDRSRQGIERFSVKATDSDAFLHHTRTGEGRIYVRYPDGREVTLLACEVSPWDGGDPIGDDYDMLHGDDWGLGVGRGAVWRLTMVRAVEPSDKDVPLPVLPTKYEPSEKDIDNASAAWDSAMPAYAGLLDAEVEE
jgi:hypothetical protein